MFFFVFSLILLQSVYSDVWQECHSWDMSWENRYSHWLENEIEPTVLQTAGLKADCADLAYGLRAIFARMNFLPFMASSKEGKRFGHFSKQWDHLPLHENWAQDKRFCTFLNDLFLHIVSTRSLHHDTYPLSLEPKTIKPGVMVYEDLIAAHVVIIGRIEKNSIPPITYYESFVPGYGIFTRSKNIEVQLYGPDTESFHSGIVAWNWPVKKDDIGKYIPNSGRGGSRTAPTRVKKDDIWEYIPKRDMPFYSEEQYAAHFPFQKRVSVLLNRLAYQKIYQKPFDEDQVVSELSQDLIVYFADRALRVIRAEQLMKKHGVHNLPQFFQGQCSTRKTDESIERSLMQLWHRMHGFGIPRSTLLKHLNQFSMMISSYYPNVSLDVLLEAYERGKCSDNVYDPFYHRWGIEERTEAEKIVRR